MENAQGEPFVLPYSSFPVKRTNHVLEVELLFGLSGLNSFVLVLKNIFCSPVLRAEWPLSLRMFVHHSLEAVDWSMQNHYVYTVDTVRRSITTMKLEVFGIISVFIRTWRGFFGFYNLPCHDSAILRTTFRAIHACLKCLAV